MSDSGSESVVPETIEPVAASRLGRAFRLLRRSVACLIWGLVATGFFMRMTVRDQFHPWALIYYLTPIPAMALWLCVAGWVWGRNSKSRDSRNWLSVIRLNRIAIIVAVTCTFFFEFMGGGAELDSSDLQCVFWNTARVPFGIDPVATQLRKWDFPVIGLVEANGYYPKVVDEWRRELPEYTVAPTHFGGLIAVKGEVKAQFNHYLLPTSWCDQFDVRVNGREFTILLVDISAQLNLSRRRPLEELAKLVETLADRPLIIMGDFNTPDDSVLLEPLRAQCHDAIRKRGVGYAATWPMPLPVLTLDQVWVNERVDVSRSEYRWSVLSDHRPGITRFSIPPSF